MNNFTPTEPEIRKFIVLHLNCPECRYMGETHRLAGDTYGILLGRTSGNQLTVFDTWKDTHFFDELSRLRSTLMPKAVEPMLSDCFRKVIGRVCDPSPSGENYDFTGKILCPNCKSSNVMHYADEPFRFAEINIPNISHKKWNTFNDDEKAIFMMKELDQLGCI